MTFSENLCPCVSSEYDATRAYAVSKLANVLHTKELAQRLKVNIKIHPQKKWILLFSQYFYVLIAFFFSFWDLTANGGERDCELRSSRDRENETH